jgi:tetratricopeptide (TPR) repeat protein
MGDVSTHLEQGLTAFKAGNIDTAIAELETATREDPTSFRAFNYLGAAYAAKGKFNAAIGAFKSAEQINPNIASIHYNIAQAYEAGGVWAEAEYEYQRALEVDPSYSRAQEALDSLRIRLHAPPSSSD